MRSHPPALVTLVAAALRRAGLGPSIELTVAVSGGPDSMALLHCLSLLRERARLSLLAVSLDHGLRMEAKAEVELVRERSEAWGVPFRSEALRLETGANLQSRAREARYLALRRLGREYWGKEALICTAHHADDRAETLLLRLVRGTTAEGLAVLPERAGDLLRPMIRARKGDVLLHLERHQVPFVRDASNENPAFQRVRVRQELLPLLEQFNPRVVEALCALAESAPQDSAPALLREQREQILRARSDPHLPLDLPLGAGLRVVRDAPRDSQPRKGRSGSRDGTT